MHVCYYVHVYACAFMKVCTVYTCMCMCMHDTCICVFMHVYMCVHICMSLCTWICMCVCMYGYMGMHACVCIHVCLPMCAYACMCACVYACMCVCVCMSVCVYGCMFACAHYVLFLTVQLSLLCSSIWPALSLRQFSVSSLYMCFFCCQTLWFISAFSATGTILCTCQTLRPCWGVDECAHGWKEWKGRKKEWGVMRGQTWSRWTLHSQCGMPSFGQHEALMIS